MGTPVRPVNTPPQLFSRGRSGPVAAPFAPGGSRPGRDHPRYPRRQAGRRCRDRCASNGSPAAGGAACPCTSTGSHSPVESALWRLVTSGRAPWPASMPVAGPLVVSPAASRSAPAGTRPPPGARRLLSPPGRPSPWRQPHRLRPVTRALSRLSAAIGTPDQRPDRPERDPVRRLDRPVGLLGSASNPLSATVARCAAAIVACPPPRSAACQRPSALRSGARAARPARADRSRDPRHPTTPPGSSRTPAARESATPRSHAGAGFQIFRFEGCLGGRSIRYTIW